MKKTTIVAAIASLTLALGGVGTAVLLQSGTVAVEAPGALVEQAAPGPETGTQNAPLPGTAAQPREETPAGTTSREDTDAGEEKTTRERAAGNTSDTGAEKSRTAEVTASAPAAEAEAAPAPAQDKADTAPAQEKTETGAAQVGGATESGNNASAAGKGEQTTTALENHSPEQDSAPQQPAQAAASSGEVVQLTNAERRKNGLPDLKTETAIQDAADLRAREVAVQFAHIRPDGSSFSTAIPGSYARYGENIAYSSGKVSAEQFLSLWMASTGHRANILNADYTGIAVGVYYDAQADVTYAVQLFVADAEDAQYTYIDTVVAPTCTEQGYTLHTCQEDAGKSYQDSYTDALGHDWDDGDVTTEATCTAAGEKTFTCRRCGENRTEEIPAAGHKTEIRGAQEATCTEQGYTGDTVCTVCGEVTEQGEAIPAAGHKTEIRSAQEATCTEQGYTGDTVCTVCGKVTEQGEAIPAAGHHFVDGQCTVCGAADPDYKPEVEYTYTDTIVDPTCTEQGYTLHTCNEDDSKSYKDSYTDALGHSFDGNNLGAQCTRCHTDLFVFSHTVAPTCQEVGYDVYTSILDPNDTRRSNFTDPVDHNYVDGYCTMCHAPEPGIPSYDDNYDKTYYNNALSTLTNQARQERGHSALRYASEYQAAADTRAQELVTSFSHTRPDGRDPDTALTEAGAQYESFGENIAYVSSMYKPGRIMDNWLASADHCANMMRDTIDSFVVGTACADGRVYAVQIFFKDASSGEKAVQEMSLDAAPEEDTSAETAPAEETPTPAQAPAQTAAPTPAPTPASTPVPTEEPAAPEETLAPETAAPAEETAASVTIAVPEVSAAVQAVPVQEEVPAETAPAEEKPQEEAAPEEGENTAPDAGEDSQELPPQQETAAPPESQELLPQAEPAPEDATPAV